MAQSASWDREVAVKYVIYHWADKAAHVMFDAELLEHCRAKELTPSHLFNEHEQQGFTHAWAVGEFFFAGGLVMARRFAKRWFPRRAECVAEEYGD